MVELIRAGNMPGLVVRVVAGVHKENQFLGELGGVVELLDTRQLDRLQAMRLESGQDGVGRADDTVRGPAAAGGGR